MLALKKSDPGIVVIYVASFICTIFRESLVSKVELQGKAGPNQGAVELCRHGASLVMIEPQRAAG